MVEVRVALARLRDGALHQYHRPVGAKCQPKDRDTNHDMMSRSRLTNAPNPAMMSVSSVVLSLAPLGAQRVG